MTIKQDRRNYRIHNDRNMQMIEKSLKDCGAGRSILIDSGDEIIAGNGCFEQAKKLGIPIRVIETDGKELVAVKRTDLTYDDSKRQQLALMDNSTSDLSEFDVDALVEDFGDDMLVDFGVIDTSDFDTEADESADEIEELTVDDISEDGKRNTAVREALEKSSQRGKDKNEIGFWLCLVFQSSEQKFEFIEKIGNPETKYGLYVDGQTLAQKMGVDITPNTLKPRKPVIEKRLADMAME